MSTLKSRMSPERRADVRELLIAEAAGPVRGPRRAALVVVAAAAVAVAAAALLIVQPDPPDDRGGWTAVPQAAPPLTAPDEDIEQWASKCNDLGIGGVGVGGVPARPEAAARREVLVDRRGEYTYCVDVSVGSGTASDPLIAISGVSSERADGLNGTAATVSDKPFTRPGPDDVLVLGGAEPGPLIDPLQVQQIFGLAGAGVTGVDLLLANGLRITATVRAGLWGAWWPADRGAPGGLRIAVRTEAGIRTVDADGVRLRR